MADAADAVRKGPRAGPVRRVLGRFRISDSPLGYRIARPAGVVRASATLSRSWGRSGGNRGHQWKCDRGASSGVEFLATKIIEGAGRFRPDMNDRARRLVSTATAREKVIRL